MRHVGETSFVRRGHRRGKPAGGPDWLVKLSGKRTACLDTPGESTIDTDGANLTCRIISGWGGISQVQRQGERQVVVIWRPPFVFSAVR